MLELLEFALFLFAFPIVISTLFMLLVRVKAEWPDRTKATILALPGPLLEVLFGVFLIAGDGASNCPPQHVCDSLAGPIGMLMILSSLPSYVISCICGFAIISRRTAK